MTLNSLIRSALGVLGASILVACSGAGSCPPGQNSSPTGSANLSLTAPNLYPAGVAVNVPLMISNSSDYAATGLTYSVPDATNYTSDVGGNITISAANQANCAIIPAHGSCQIMASIAASPISHPGSFTVVATPQSSASVIGKLSTEVKSWFSKTATAEVISLTANIGLVDLPANTASGINALTPYYPSTVLENESGATNVIISVAVSSADVGAPFNTIQLVDSSGNVLSNAQLLTGNSGNGATNLSKPAVVSYLVAIPHGVSQLTFKLQTLENGVVVATGSDVNTILVNSVLEPQGILSIQPNYFNLMPSYTSQPITYSNTGNGAITNLVITPDSPLRVSATNCGNSLAVGASCTYTLTYPKDQPIKGVASVVANYNITDTTTASATATVNYSGVDALAGLSIVSGSNPNFDFSSTTTNNSMTSLVTITNTGNNLESNIVYTTLPNVFNVSTTGVNNPCGSAPFSLAAGASCNVNLIYTNATLTSLHSATITLSYDYLTLDGSHTASSNVAVTYTTIHSTASLLITPNPYTYGTIVNNGVESLVNVFTVTNSGDETATGMSPSLATGTFFTKVTTIPQCGASLAVGESCNLSVRFGAAESSVVAGTQTDTLNVSYIPYTGATQLTASSALSGQVATAQSAIIVPAFSESNGFIAGDGTTSNSAYQVQESAIAPTVKYTLTNNGFVSATNFAVTAGSLGAWIQSNNCPVTLASQASCTLSFSLATSVTGANNLDLTQVHLAWNDQDSPSAQQTQNLSGTVYASVFSAPSIAITSTPTTNISVAPGESFTITATLSGGYNVQAQTIHATTTTSDVTFTNNNCGISSSAGLGSCVITVNVGASAVVAPSNIVTLSNATTSSMAPAPNTVNFAVAVAPAVVQIALPQTGQLYCVPTPAGNFTTSCGSALPSPVGSDGYGQPTVPTYGDYIPYGVAWAYNGSADLVPLTRFTIGLDANNNACTSGQEIMDDNLTGLMWQQSPSTTTVKWQDTSVTPNTYPAQESINAMNASGYCGYTDWRLPNVNELASLVNQGASDTSTWLNAHGFSNVQSNILYYWSSTTVATNSNQAWVVDMTVGRVYVSAQGKSGMDNYVWAVRGNTAMSQAPAKIPQTGQTISYVAGDDGALQAGTTGTDSSGRFAAGSLNEADCITDKQTGLMWPKNGTIGFHGSNGVLLPQPDYVNTIPALNAESWGAALTAVSRMNSGTLLCGHNDWRLPNRNELRSLVNYGQTSMSLWLNSQGFIGIQASNYWSSTTFTQSRGGNAWYVYMTSGYVYNEDKYNPHYILPVRGGGSVGP